MSHKEDTNTSDVVANIYFFILELVFKINIQDDICKCNFFILSLFIISSYSHFITSIGIYINLLLSIITLYVKSYTKRLIT